MADRQTTELEILNAELEAANHEAHKARAAADAANRAKSQFLANMSHELRTPINAIIGYTELLAMGVSGPITPNQLSQLERVRASSKHLLTLIDDVLDLAKVEAGQMHVTLRSGLVPTVVNDALALIAIQAGERGIAIIDECSRSPVSYVGDELRVRQILTNLLSNAVKFTESGGRITIRCGIVDTAPAEIGLAGNGPWTFIEVEDTGVGIAEQEIAQIFRPFVQAEMGRQRIHGGTGLGLTISRQLARLMGGDLCAASKLGKGSTFTLWLSTETAAHGEIDDSIRV